MGGEGVVLLGAEDALHVDVGGLLGGGGVLLSDALDLLFLCLDEFPVLGEDDFLDFAELAEFGVEGVVAVCGECGEGLVDGEGDAVAVVGDVADDVGVGEDGEGLLSGGGE